MMEFLRTKIKLKLGVHGLILHMVQIDDLEYKGFDFNLSITGVSGNDIFNANKINTYPMKLLWWIGSCKCFKEYFKQMDSG